MTFRVKVVEKATKAITTRTLTGNQEQVKSAASAITALTLAGADQKTIDVAQAIAFPLSLHNSNGFRCFLLRLFGAKIGKRVVIRPSASFLYPWKVAIGDYSWIGDDVVFYSVDQITVGSHCVISQKSYLCTGSHNIDKRSFALITAPIKIGNGAWVATDCFVAAGVNIDSNSVIGARSSVMKSIPSKQVAWGTPCTPRYPRKIGD